MKDLYRIKVIKRKGKAVMYCPQKRTWLFFWKDLYYQVETDNLDYAKNTIKDDIAWNTPPEISYLMGDDLK